MLRSLVGSEMCIRDRPYAPEVAGERRWLEADASRRIVHSQQYHVPEEFAGKVVMIVGARSSGVDIARELHGVAAGIYVLDKKCSEVQVDAVCCWVPDGCALRADGRLEIVSKEHDPNPHSHPHPELVPGLEVDTIVLATGYEFDFPFLSAEALGMRWGRFVTPLYQHIVHATKPTLAFIGIPLMVPCPIPLFEVQSRFLAMEWGLPARRTTHERESWVLSRERAVEPRSQDLHYMGAKASAWGYMRELMGMCELQPGVFEDWCARMEVVEAVYCDRVAKRPSLPWEDDWYRRCEYTVDWKNRSWTVKLPEDKIE
eukprot:TRINITY_DN48832_c0_g1_i2.p1 TRINITY_DN48832_c0_g1~~TRINITY_DN48832_c0_g1_i2.p1  ORF type:complete len:339 (+),score=72.19 TRINITY_DN48832_c0_g1_i2:74-1018(+)